MSLDRTGDRAAEGDDARADEHASPYLTREQAARFLNVSEATLDRRDQIPRLKDGRLVQYDIADLIAYKESCKEGGPMPVRRRRDRSRTRMPAFAKKCRKQPGDGSKKLNFFERFGIKPPPPRPRID